MSSKTTARPRCTIRCADAAEGFSTAPSGARLPRSTAIPPEAVSAFSTGRITSAFQLRTSLTSSQIGPPETVSASLCRCPPSPSALMTTGKPPA